VSQDQQSSQKNTKQIEIVLGSKNSVSYKNGSLKCQLNQATFPYVEHLVWKVIFQVVLMKEMFNTLNVATCRLVERKP